MKYREIMAILMAMGGLVSAITGEYTASACFWIAVAVFSFKK